MKSGPTLLVAWALLLGGVWAAAEEPPVEAPGPDPAAVLAEMDRLLDRANASYLSGNPAKGLALSQKALALGESAFGQDDPRLLQALNAVAALLGTVQKPGEARGVYERAIGIVDRMSPRPARLDAALRAGLARVLRSSGKPAEAEAELRRALDRYETLLPPGDSELEFLWSELAYTVTALGRHEEAERLFRKLLALRESNHGPEAGLTASTLGDLGGVLQSMARYDEALSVLTRALAISERTWGPTHFITAGTLGSLGLVLMEMGRLEAARPHLERSVRAYEATYGPDHPEVASSLANLAGLLEELGQHDDALALFERAVGIDERTRGPKHPHLANVLAGLAEVLEARGDLPGARAAHERAVAITERSLGPDHPTLASWLTNLARVLRRQGELDEAAGLLERAVRMREVNPGKDHPLTATTLIVLADVRNEQSRFDDSASLLRRVLASTETTFGADHPEVAQVLLRLSWALRHAGRTTPAEALPLLERAVAILEGDPLSRGGSVALAWNHLATFLAQRGDEARATRLFDRSLTWMAGEIRQRLVATHGGARLAMAAAARHRFEEWLSVTGQWKDPGYAMLLRFKGLTGRVERAERELLRSAGPSERAALEELRASERLLSAWAGKAPGRRSATAEDREAWRAKVAAEAARHDRLHRGLVSAVAPYRAALERSDASVAEVQAGLGPDDVLLDVIRGRDSYVAWVVRPETPPVRVALGAVAEIDTAAEAFAHEARTKEADDPELLAAGRRLKALIWTPLEKRWGEGVRRVWLALDGALAAVPYAALPGQGPGTWLADDVLLAHVTMAQDLVPRAPGASSGQGVLLLGGIQYDRVGDATAGPAPPRANRRTFEPLPGTLDEVRDLATRWGDEALLLSGEDATEEALRVRSRGRRRLHLATHGFVRTDLARAPTRPDSARAIVEGGRVSGIDPMVLPGLALAGANGSDARDRDDGILTALEAAALDLEGCELVVLSACETGLGRPEAGEGVLGLVQGFQRAGAGTVVATLWEVDDAATRLAMAGFYAALDGAPPPTASVALRETCRSLRSGAAAGGRTFTAPRYWAPFVVYERR